MSKIEPTEETKETGPEIEKAFTKFGNAVGVAMKDIGVAMKDIGDAFNEYMTLFDKHWQEVVKHEYNKKINKEKGEDND